MFSCSPLFPLGSYAGVAPSTAGVASAMVPGCHQDLARERVNALMMPSNVNSDPRCLGSMSFRPHAAMFPPSLQDGAAPPDPDAGTSCSAGSKG